MLTFENKMSGTRCDGWEHINPTETLQLTPSGALRIDKLTTVEAVEFVVKHYNLHEFNPPHEKQYVGTYLDCDDEVKVAIMEAYPDERAELIDYFGERWAEQYIRFGH